MHILCVHACVRARTLCILSVDKCVCSVCRKVLHILGMFCVYTTVHIPCLYKCVWVFPVYTSMYVGSVCIPYCPSMEQQNPNEHGSKQGILSDNVCMQEYYHKVQYCRNTISTLSSTDAINPPYSVF